MKKTVKIILIVISVLLLGVILFFVCSFFGNPVSYLLALNSADDYIEENYADYNLEVEKIGYDFKSSGYYAKVVSPTSVDTHFSVYFDLLGRPIRDSFENVTDGWNTHMRLENEYREITDKVFEDESFGFTSDICYGEIKIYEKSDDYTNGEPYGIVMSELKTDYDCDIKDVARTAGHIVFYFDETDLSAKNVAKKLLEFKLLFDEKGIPFYAVDFVAQEPATEEKIANRKEFAVREFRYSDIYEEGLEERLEKAANDLKSYYTEEDAKK